MYVICSDTNKPNDCKGTPLLILLALQGSGYMLCTHCMLMLALDLASANWDARTCASHAELRARARDIQKLRVECGN